MDIYWNFENVQNKKITGSFKTGIENIKRFIKIIIEYYILFSFPYSNVEMKYRVSIFLHGHFQLTNQLIRLMS